MDMDQKQAQQLKERIQREVPYINTDLTLVTAMGEHGEWKTWAVDILERGSNKFLMRIESPSAWEVHKFYFRLPPS